MAIPNFLIIGVQKSATSWLSVNLNEHNEIYIERDEKHFFNNPQRYKKGLSWYLSQFENIEGVNAIGEKTPEYMWVSERNGNQNNHNYNIPELVHLHFPKMKLIVVLRDPVERAISAYLYFIRGGNISPRLKLKTAINQFGILEMGSYYQQLLYWFKYFSKNQVLIFVKETDVDLYPQNTLKKCCKFLNVDPLFPFSNYKNRVNVGWTDLEIIISYCLKYHQGLRSNYKKIRKKIHPYFSLLRQRKNKTGFLVSESDFNFLYKFYQEDYNKLEKLLDVNLSVWRR